MDLDCCMQLIHKLFTSTVHPGREDLGTCMRCAASCLHKGRLQHLHLRTQHVLPGCVHLLLLLLLWRFWCWLAGILSQQGPQRLQQIWAQAVTQQLYMLDIWQSSLAVSNRLALTSQLQLPAAVQAGAIGCWRKSSSSPCCRYLRESLVAALRNPMETFQRRARFINYGEHTKDHHSKLSCSPVPVHSGHVMQHSPGSQWPSSA